MNVKRREAILASASTLPFALALADKGWRKALKDDPHLRAGLKCTMASSPASRSLRRMGSPTRRPSACSAPPPDPARYNLAREPGKIRESKRK
jgi:hypothetical protein